MPTDDHQALRPVSVASRQSAGPSDQEQQRALAEMESVLDELARPDCDLVSATMRARQAYDQLGMQSAAALLKDELTGYPQGDVPYYRQATAQIRWITSHTRAAVREAITGNPLLADRFAQVPLHHALAALVQCREAGFQYTTDQTQLVPFTALGMAEQVQWRQQITILPVAITSTLEAYRAEIHHAIGERVIALRAGFEATSLWAILRADADQLAVKAGLGDDLRSIVRAAVGSDTSAWEGALTRCRNVIDKLSKYLYRGDGKTYPYIPDGTGKGPMAVDGTHYKNRLVAYLHQKGLNATDRQVADTHLEWFAGFVERANSLGSKGKQAVPRHRDVANGVMHLYLLLSEVAARTDGEPVTSLRDPSGGGQALGAKDGRPTSRPYVQ